jgi:hypothetical protein
MQATISGQSSFSEHYLLLFVCLSRCLLHRHVLEVDDSQDTVVTPNPTILGNTNPRFWGCRLFRTEIKIFLSLLEQFRATLAEVDWSGEPERWDLARLALDYSDEAVTGLQTLVNEYDCRKPSRWNDVRLVMRKGKFEKHLGRIEKAKGYILASRTNLSL